MSKKPNDIDVRSFSSRADPKWVTVAVAAAHMGLRVRGAQKRLRKLDAELDGRLLNGVATIWRTDLTA
jgi:hypothetical protein